MSSLYLLANSGIPVSTLDYKDVAGKLGELWAEWEGRHHMVVVTLGSKMQHFGTFLFLLAHWDVGLVLSEPGEFVADRFSTGIGASWIVDLGEIGELNKLVRRRGVLEFEWDS